MIEINSWPPGGEDAQIDLLAARYIDGMQLDLAGVLRDPEVGRIALVSSFGAESVVLLHRVLEVSPETDVLFLDTGKHFPETLDYVDQVVDLLAIRNFKRLLPDAALIKSEDPKGDLHKTAPNSCCTIRKTFLLQDALVNYDGWITGRKRFQGNLRANLAYLERDGQHLKINPLILETPDSIQAYMDRHGLPPHPLVDKGYRSIGCACCTRPTKEGEDSRAGRWDGTDKVECGIHLGPGGNFVRQRSS